MELFLTVLRFDYDLSTCIGTAGGSIGRSADNDLVLSDTERYVSRIHAKIEFDGNSFFIVDCSSNGTLLLELIPDSEDAYNEVLIHQDRRELFDGDTIVIGQFEIQIQYRETTSEPSIKKEVNVSQPKVDSTLPKNEAVEQAFKPPVFPKTPVVEVDREDYESDSVDRSALQHFPAHVAIESDEPDDIEPEVFYIDDFFADDNNGNEHGTNENAVNEEDDIFANFQEPFAEELEPEQISSEITKNDNVQFSVFSPFNIKRGNIFILDVWAYLPDQSSFIKTIAKEMERERVLGNKCGIPVERGTILSVAVQIDFFDIKESTDTIFWNGIPVNASFTVRVPFDLPTEQSTGKAIISYEGMIIAKINFLVSVTDAKGIIRYNSSYSIISSVHTYWRKLLTVIGFGKVNIDYRYNSQELIYPKTAFASYASEDRNAVLSRIQGMKKVAPDLDIFFDVISLRSGENWKEKIVEHVPNKDVFYLFWSQFAASSEWVEKEWRLALCKRGLDYISPILLEDIEVALPPSELQTLHFSDAYVAYIQLEKIKKQKRKITHQ